MITFDANMIGILNWGFELVKQCIKVYIYANTTSDGLIHFAMCL